MDMKTERRSYARLAQEDSLEVQVLAASASPGLVGQILHCSSLDASALGLRMKVAAQVPVCCAIDLWVDLRARAQTYFLHGQVRWCEPVQGQSDIYQVGVQLLDMPFTDFESWRRIFAADGAPPSAESPP